MWLAEAIITDGLQSPRKAVKISVSREEKPDINWLVALEAQAIGQYRVQFQEWPPEGAKMSQFRQRDDPTWHPKGELVGQGTDG